MTCRCKAQFCYVCGMRWHTCGCTEQQLAVRLAEVEARRLRVQAQEQAAVAAAAARERAERARQAQEEAMAEELREILQLIDDFELAEATRLAEEAEAERAVALALRQRREEEELQAIGRHFDNLREEMGFVHSVQKIAMLDRYKAESEAARKEGVMKGGFEKIEKTYRENLRAAEAEVDSVREIFQGDAAFLKWPSAEAMRQAIANFRADTEKAKSKIAEVQSCYKKAKEKAEAISEAFREVKEEELERKRQADQRWMAEVERVRGEMLDEMAVVEYARLADGGE